MSKLKDLTEGDMGVCKILAGVRTATARAKGVQRPFSTGFRNHVENEEASIIAEYAFCKTYNLFFNGVFGIKDSGYDCVLKGKRIDIKSTTRPDGNLLVKRNTDKSMVDIYVLIHVIDHEPKIVGWVSKDDVVQDSNLREMSENDYCYCVYKDKLNPWESENE